MNGTVVDRQGEVGFGLCFKILRNPKVGEGTSIDFEEPVVITIQCDSDGWVMQVDKLLYITLNI